MKTAIRLGSAFVLVTLLLTFPNPRVFAQGSGNSTVHCGTGADLQTKLDNSSAGATVWVTGICAQGPYTISKDVSLTALVQMVRSCLPRAAMY